MSNIEQLQKIPNKTKFLLWLTNLFRNKLAEFHKGKENIILLKPLPSNFFIIGKDNENELFIGVQDKMMPWFMEINWNTVYADFENKYLYFSASGSDSDDLILGLKCRLKRMEIINTLKATDVNIRVYKFNKSSSKIEIALSNYATIPLKFSSEPEKISTSVTHDDEYSETDTSFASDEDFEELE